MHALGVPEAFLDTPLLMSWEDGSEVCLKCQGWTPVNPIATVPGGAEPFLPMTVGSNCEESQVQLGIAVVAYWLLLPVPPSS